VAPVSPRSSRKTIRLPKAIFFDMDDTIFDHSLTCRGALARLRRTESRLRGPSLNAVWHEYARLLDEVQPDVLAGRVTVQDARIERFCQLARFCGTEVSSAAAAEFSRRYRAHYQKLRRTVPGVRRVLERLRGRAVVGVVTNNEVAEQEQKLDHLHLRPLIDFMIVSAGVGISKPDPGIFRLALAKAGALPEETVMVGDSWRSDIVGARNTGIRPVWFNRFHLSPPEPWPVRELDSFRSPAHAEAVVAGAAAEPLSAP
jgi:putative hydrolase of the HAD superfamily